MQGHGRPLPHIAFQVEGAAGQGRQRFDDRQAEAGPRLPALMGAIHLHEGFSTSGISALAMPMPRILDQDLRLGGVEPARNEIDRAIPRRELDSVRDQVGRSTS